MKPPPSKGTPDTLWQETMARLKSGHGLGVTRKEWAYAARSRIAFQSDMLKAQRIVLDRGFIRAAVAASTLPPSILASRLALIRPPYPLTWIEWDEEIRLKALEEVGYIKSVEEARGREADGEYYEATRVGVILRTNDTSHIMRLTGNVSGKLIGSIKNTYSMQPIILAYREGKDKSLLECGGLNMGWCEDNIVAPERSQTISYSLGAALGTTYAAKTGVPLDENHPLARHLAAGIGGPFSHLAMSALASRRMGHEKRGDLLESMALSAVGDWRFTASVLLLWNTRGPLLESAGRASPAGGGEGRRGDEVRVARIVLPAPRRERRESGEPSGRASPRLYDYSEHWCYSAKAENGCHHDWQRRYEGDDRRHECAKCGARRWWRRSGKRGDASRGTITKVYEATAKVGANSAPAAAAGEPMGTSPPAT